MKTSIPQTCLLKVMKHNRVPQITLLSRLGLTDNARLFKSTKTLVSMHNKASTSKQTQTTVHSSAGLSLPNTIGTHKAINGCHQYQLSKPATEPVPKQDTRPRSIISNQTYISDNLSHHQIMTFFKPRAQASDKYKDNSCGRTKYQ